MAGKAGPVVGVFAGVGFTDLTGLATTGQQTGDQDREP
jgi:hypothetical protein